MFGIAMTFLLNIQDCEISVVIGVISLYVQQEEVPTKNQKSTKRF